MEILNPIFSMVILTALVGFALGGARFASIKKGQVDGRYFKLMSGYELPEHLKQLERNFGNLLELPVLFYVVCVLSLVLTVSSPLFLSMAWAFVGLRVLHTAIHISYNHPLHRFLIFLLSTLVLLGMWYELYSLVSQG
ncbi:hypothetical protein HMF8227_00193 [Saliniradius amylolyticus]|uniref:MAPEG family protein n=1 Tax=Saliniradius amylolyticus TaxID=2183582 RepID=A0A2S2DZ81_9ALTE|nr:MAPEG family protein [Saliniradius amylolyticus]AWL10701.1 hypothetical protein HMF8227_00193 [Saliniradius amylolyticus]